MNYDVNVKDNEVVMILMDGAHALAKAEDQKAEEVRNAEESNEETIRWTKYRYLKARAMYASLLYTFARNQTAEAKTYTPDTPVGRADLAVYAAKRDKAKAEYTLAALIAGEAEDAWRESHRNK